MDNFYRQPPTPPDIIFKVTSVKRKPKKDDGYRYVPIDKATRWQACQYIGKLLYWSDLENQELVGFLNELREPPQVVSVVKRITEELNESEENR